MTYAYTTSAHFIFLKKEGGRGRQQISTNKTCYEIKKILKFLLSIEGGSGEARVAGGAGVQFLQKKKLN